jgi:hypothetical protein
MGKQSSKQTTSRIFEAHKNFIETKLDPIYMRCLSMDLEICMNNLFLSFTRGRSYASCSKELFSKTLSIFFQEKSCLCHNMIQSLPELTRKNIQRYLKHKSRRLQAKHIFL